ncbi:hypothetical protein EOD43_11290 [Sphingomonas crocodyli]|uniref:Sel1 repeat family protein n=2 Tax=Sphingomonas crocodyli TaxID=1979270 RepID=A0A437MBY4_9SPHN|nr:hypothetical protein EOD43_11290 [Sphingomonas crocodyli]
MKRTTIAAAMLSLVIAAPVRAETPRELLLDAAFDTHDKANALKRIDQAQGAATAQLARTPADRDARLSMAMAVGYRAKLTRSRGEAMSAKRLFDGLAATDPRDPEAAAAVGCWHLDSVIELGGMIAGMALGAKKATGLAAMDRAVALGGGRAMFPGLAGLLRIAIDPADARGRALIDMTTRAQTPEKVDKLFQRSAAAVLAQLRAGRGELAQELAKELLPFGKVKR